MEPLIFSVQDVDYGWEDLLAGAELRGDLDPLWRRTALGLACEREAGRRELELDLVRLQATADGLRYRYNLITAEETERWFAQRRLSIEQFEEHLCRRTWIEQLGEECEEAPVEPDAVAAELWPDLVLWGDFDRLALALARRAAAGGEPPAPGAVNEVQQALCGRLGIAAEQLRAWYEQTRFLRARLDRHLLLEARYRQQAGALLTEAALQRELAAQQLPLTRVTVEVAGFDSPEAAKEAYFCVTGDGDSLELIANQTGAVYEQQQPLLAELPEQLASRITSATPGQVIGPIARHERYWVYRLRGKQPPALSDDGVRAMLEERLLRRHFDDAVAERVSWHCWRPE